MIWEKLKYILYSSGLLIGFICHTEVMSQPFYAPDTAGRSERATPFAAVPPYILRTYQFADTSGMMRAEVLFGLVNDLLQFAQINPARYRASYEANLAIFDGHDAGVAGRTLKRDLEVSHFTATNDRAHLNQEHVSLRLPPGNYQLRVEIVDGHTRRRLRRQYPLTLPDFYDGKLHLSSLSLRDEFADSIEAFAKDSFNLPAVLAPGKSGQSLYYEIYGAPERETVKVDYALTNWKGDTLAAWNNTFTAAGRMLKCIENLAGRISKRGSHHLHVRVTGAGQSATAKIAFKVQTPAVLEHEDFANFVSAAGCAPLQYISPEKDFQTILAATGAAQDSLIAAFWQRRDPTPNTAANELREEFYRRAAQAEASFALADGKAGWQTDRGRIYLIYGPPREVQVRVSEPETLLYEIWLYPQNDRRFIFRERAGSGVFELINR